MTLKFMLSRPFLPLISRIGTMVLRAGFLSLSASKKLFALLNRYVAHRGFTSHAKTIFGDKIKCDTKDFIQKHIVYFGQWEPSFSSYLLAKSRSDGIFLDIGANIGYFSLLASHRYEKVISFEASSKIFQLLQDNIESNSINNITPHHIAIGAEEKDVFVNIGNDANIGTTSISDQNSSATKETIRMMPFQTILSAEELSDVRFIKIDIEGAEPPVVESLIASLPNMHPNLELVIEVTPSQDSKEQQTLTKMFDNLLAHGFTARILQEEYLVDDYLIKPDISILDPITSFPLKQTDVLFVMGPVS